MLLRSAAHLRTAFLCLWLGACSAPQQTHPDAAPTAWPQMVATAHPDATRAGLAMLAQGGSAADAAIAAQMVLGLVEPQSSGLGGGAVAMHWDAQANKLSSWDALASAPARVTPALGVDVDGSGLNASARRYGGRSVGVPGALPLMAKLHQDHGKLPWAALFAPAIQLAESGFALPRYLHSVLAADSAARDHPEMLALYFGANGKVLPVGSQVRNPAYAKTLRDIAEKGARGWLQGGAAQDIVAAAQRGYRPSLMTAGDVLAFQPEPREALCAPFERFRVCMMAPSSFGGVVVLQMLQMLQHLQPAPQENTPTRPRFNFDDPAFVHQYVEAGRMAQADRLLHIGDPAFLQAPLAQLLNPAYLQQRALTIDMSRRAAAFQSGVPRSPGSPLLPGTPVPEATTSQIAVADRAGNALSITTTINLNFGSRLMVGGYVLNNAMTNFSPEPARSDGRANQMAPGKRPTSSMAPTMVFDETGRPVLVGGSAGGGQIVDYIAQALIEMLVHGRSPRQALARGHVSTAVVGTVQLERGTSAQALAPALGMLGHKVNVTDMTSGLAFIQRTPQGWRGAADPRRDGIALAQ